MRRLSENGATDGTAAATTAEDVLVSSVAGISADGSANGTSPMVLPLQHALLQEGEFVGPILRLQGQKCSR